MGKDKAFGAVIVETRPLKNLVEVINNHVDHISHIPGWSLTIFCNMDNEYTLKNNFPFAKIVNLGCHLNESHYNYLLTNKLFWETMDSEKILIFQHDSLILRSGIEEFMDYDYIGSPWPWKPYVGNGGFSIRSKQAMIDTINKTPYRGEGIHGNEDVYFCNHLVGKLASLEVAEKFCVESVYKLSTFAMHACEKYLTTEQVNLIKNQYHDKLQIH